MYEEPSVVQGWGVAWERRVARDTELRSGIVGRLLVWRHQKGVILMCTEAKGPGLILGPW